MDTHSTDLGFLSFALVLGILPSVIFGLAQAGAGPVAIASR